MIAADVQTVRQMLWLLPFHGLGYGMRVLNPIDSQQAPFQGHQAIPTA